jgi:hypothetical protein
MGKEYVLRRIKITIKPAARRSRDKTLGVTAVVFGPILSGTQEIRKGLFGS